MEFDLKNKKDRKHLFAHILTLLQENGSGKVNVEYDAPMKESEYDW